ncbi:natural resistance-associated macrophage protein 3 [Actinidia rufa]|uniref:Natural resistance-associated macrophage protein 3 n=1 Tax=Actinidia rufa TaxID=165716 RepID=A0A7J0EHQ7_9ERIC|nr:natural resistance-associated macrophage protein 3 [Actinidia rufa]
MIAPPQEENGGATVKDEEANRLLYYQPHDEELARERDFSRSREYRGGFACGSDRRLLTVVADDVAPLIQLLSARLWVATVQHLAELCREGLSILGQAVSVGHDGDSLDWDRYSGEWECACYQHSEPRSFASLGWCSDYSL